MYELFIENNLISPNQSGFIPGGLCINLLLPITHEIYKSFDDGLKVWGIFSDISKTFDKVWHKGLLYKLKQKCISGKLFDTITDFLNFRKQRVVLNGQYSSLISIEAGVLQGSILGPLLFLIYIKYINDLSDDLTANVKLFAKGTSLFSIVHNMNRRKINLKNNLNKIKNWTIQWKLNFNPDPSKQAQEVIFSRNLQKTNHNQVCFNRNSVKQVPSQKHLGMYLETKLNFQEHLNKQGKQNYWIITETPSFLPHQSLVTAYKAFMRPHIDYGDIIYDQTYNDSFHQKSCTSYNRHYKRYL